MALREAIYEIFGAIAKRRAAPAKDLHELQAAYREAIAHASLTATGRRFRWQLNGGLDAVDLHIARGVVALLE